MILLSIFNQQGVTDFSKVQILEIGSFLGVVSICLAKIGFKVTAVDLPIFSNNKRLLQLYKDNNINYYPMDLKDGRFPFDNNMFDFVIMCETLEHLNFNPIPSIKEIYRVLNSSGAVYIALPNLAGWANRKNLLLGKSIHSPISFYFDQYDLTKNLIVAIHWREFTASEMCELLSRLDFAIVKQYYYSALGTNIENKLSIIGKIFKWIVFPLFPSLRDTIVTISRKNKKPL